jgi:preprotein translocase subunit SecY
VAKLTSFIQAFRTPDLRNKLLFTLGIIAMFRFGSTLPVPGISERDVLHCSGLSSDGGSVIAVIPGEIEQIYLTKGIRLP